MKTSEKILIAAGLTALVLAGAAYCFAGIPLTRKAEEEYGAALEWHPGVWEHADAGILEDGKRISVNGMSILVPQELRQRVLDDGTLSDNRYEYRDSDDHVIYMAWVTPPTEWGELTFNDLKPRLRWRLDSYFRKIGKERPQDWCSLSRVLYDLDMKDSNPHSYTDSGIFYFLALLKSKMIPLYPSHAYLFENESGIGTVSIREPREDATGYSAYIDLFSRDDLNTDVMAVVNAPDAETLYQIINSAERVPYEAPEPDPQPQPEKRELTEEEQQAINALLEKIGEQ